MPRMSQKRLHNDIVCATMSVMCTKMSALYSVFHLEESFLASKILLVQLLGYLADSSRCTYAR
jgi:hypothetical protein